jgi:hypothetical protein
MQDHGPLTPQQILDATASHFGQAVLKLTAPGGRSRTSFRAYFADRTVIVSQRKDAARVAVERQVLAALAGLTDRVPQLLGTSGGLTFQSDVGQDRLNWRIHTLPADQRLALAAQAVQAILDIHLAAKRTDLAATLRPRPPDDLLLAPQRLAAQLRYTGPNLDPGRLSPQFHTPPTQFVKWDCRAGNAALDPSGHLRWFDFEDARLAHGPEDLAFLIADETWPLDMTLMLDMVETRLTPDITTTPQAFMTYLAEYTTLHAIRRLRLIFSEVRRKGWSNRSHILKFDHVGTNPHMGERLSRAAGDLSLRTPSTAPLKPLFDQVTEVFCKVRLPDP